MIWFALILITCLISYVNIYIALKLDNRDMENGFRLYNPRDPECIIGFIVASIIPGINVIQLIRTVVLYFSNKLYLYNKRIV